MITHGKCIPPHADQKMAISSSVPDIRQAMLEEVRFLVEMGASIILLHPREKRPIDNGWSEAPVLSWKELKAVYRPGMNLGLRPGKWSKVGGLFLHVIDLDIRDPDAADEADEALEAIFTKKVWKLPRVISGSGGQSRHIYFLSKTPLPSRNLAKSKVMVKGQDGKSHRAWEIDLVASKKQVVLPPSIHPITGEPYRWEVEFDPTSELPTVPEDGLEAILFPDEEERGEHDAEPLGLESDEIEDMLQWLDSDYWCEKFEGWRNLGMALHHEFDGSDEGFEIWCKYSEKSDKYSFKQQKIHWRSYKEKTDRPITMRSIVKASREGRREAERASYVDDFDDLEEEEKRQKLIDAFDDLDEPEDEGETPKLDVPKHLLSVPGVLQRAVDYYNATAEKPQPQFAVQTALAIGSVALSRNWKTNKRNFSTLYLLNVAPTAAGKEHLKTVLEEVLEESGVGTLLAPEEFSSGAAIFWHMLENPRSISVTDEYGIYLSTGRDSSSTLKRETRKMQMELFGRPHGILRGIGYSMAKATKDQIEAAKNRKVVRPAFIQVGMTTPETFYEALSDKEVQSGYLNRFIIVRSPLGRQLSREDVPDAEIPRELIDWVKKVVKAHGGTAEDDDRSFGKETTYVFPPKIIPFDRECLLQLREYEIALKKKMDAMDKENGLGSLHARTREIAMRVAMIVAVSCGSKVIHIEHLEWAWDYVSYYHGQMIEDFSANLGKTEIEGVCDAVLEMVTRAGERGLTKRDIARRCRPFSRLSIRDGEEVLARLERNGQMRFEEIDREGRGAKRRAYVATKRKRKGEDA